MPSTEGTVPSTKYFAIPSISEIVGTVNTLSDERARIRKRLVLRQ